MSRPSGQRPLLTTAVGLSVLGLGAALVSQHGFDMQPCAWCVLQRLLLLITGAAVVVALAGGPTTTRVAGAGAILSALTGVAAAVWQHLVAAQSSSCALTLADRVMSWSRLDAWWPEVFQPRASCADAQVKLLGLPYELWSAGLFALVAALTAAALLRRPRR